CPRPAPSSDRGPPRCRLAAGRRRLVEHLIFDEDRHAGPKSKGDRVGRPRIERQVAVRRLQVEHRVVDVVTEVGDDHVTQRDFEAGEQREKEIVREWPRRRHVIERERDSIELGGPDHHRKAPLVALAAEQDDRRLAPRIEVGGQDLDLLRAGELGRRPVATVAWGPGATREAGQDGHRHRHDPDATARAHEGSYVFTAIRPTRACASVYSSGSSREWPTDGVAPSRKLTPAPASRSTVRIPHMYP